MQYMVIQGGYATYSDLQSRVKKQIKKIDNRLFLIKTTKPSILSQATMEEAIVAVVKRQKLVKLDMELKGIIKKIVDNSNGDCMKFCDDCASLINKREDGI
jgi:hypothetical protein